MKIYINKAQDPTIDPTIIHLPTWIEQSVQASESRRLGLQEHHLIRFLSPIVHEPSLVHLSKNVRRIGGSDAIAEKGVALQ